MTRILWAISGFCAAGAGFLLWRSRRTPDVEKLAQTLEAAWADHHTLV